ncbi:cytochrome P450 [Kineococcus sp. SYSU DK018]|uniref:cytochrome P450 n=1 Tax=Kineococcus sp. SYSU DK018 TaxID=3383139 RepID=UPI003D7DCF2D
MSRPAPVADWVTIPDLYRDPFPIYDRLRAEGGVHWVPAVGRYLITTYDAVHATEVDQGTFSANEEGSLQIRAMGHSMLRRDDPEHYLERKAWQPVLRPGVVKRTWTSVFERNADRYLAELVEKGPGADLVRDFAAPFAAENLREVLGFHNVTQQDLQRWSQTLIDATGNYADDPDVWSRGERSFDEVDVALDEMLRWHADHPDHSLISTLLRTPDYEMPIERIRANVKMTIGGGLNEPRDALGVAAWALLTHPEQRRLVEDGSSSWQAVFDEAVRWVAPIGLYSRQVTRDTVLAGVRLPAGGRLGICILSANRDERVWTDPAAFDVQREVKPHLAFSKGVHVCLGAWVARAEVAAVGLPALFGRLEGLDLVPEHPAEIGGWVFRGMLELPVTWRGTRSSAAPPVPAASAAASVPGRARRGPSVAVVGAGPAGCFTAQAVRRALPAARIDVFDRLPVPYGLVRYGVAADHQGTKAVARQFDRLFRDEEVRFHGNVTLGGELDLATLRSSFDAVVLATGLHEDEVLAVPGARLAGVTGSGRLTRTLNGHPDEHDGARTVEPLGGEVVVVGHGNVAVDVVRLLTRDRAGLHGSDVDDAVRDRLVESLRVVHVVGRSLPHRARFDPVVLQEVADLPGVAHVVHGLEDAELPAGDARVEAVRALAATAAPGARVRVEWWFGFTPERFEGTAHVEAACFRGPRGPVRLACDSVVTAVGFRADGTTPLVPGAHGAGRVEPGLYVAGWLRRGPRGTIAEQRADARDLAALIRADLTAGAPGAVGTGRPGSDGLPPLPGAVDFDGWRRIDLRETLDAAPGRVRTKICTREELLRTARSDLPLPRTDPGRAGRSAAIDLPVTIAFGTESGNAELVAEDLRRRLEARTAVEVVDLATATPEDLAPDRFLVVVCSTYGDGELPTGVRPFRERLLARRPDLSGSRYAVFGLGDRSYTRTYSRGSELLDEALARCGAVRVGEYGRHDAGGGEDAVQVAADWIEGVLAEVAAPAPVGAGA